jgi:hypothetical protein
VRSPTTFTSGSMRPLPRQALCNSAGRKGHGMPCPDNAESLMGAIRFDDGDQELSGSAMVKVLPWPSCDSTQICPPWASTRMRLMYKPRPSPGDRSLAR